MLVHLVLGHSELPRRPLLPMCKGQASDLISNPAIQSVLVEEKRLVESS